MGLFLNRWSVAECSAIFETLTRQLFHEPKEKSKGVLQRIRRITQCWISDGCYEVPKLEAALQHKFGKQQKFFGYTRHPFNHKIAVTATMTSDAYPIVFSNYNGTIARPKDCGKTFVQFIY